MWFTSGSVTKAKEAKDDTEYSKVTDTLKTTLEEKYTAATSLLEGETKLKNLDASSNLDTTKATLESAKTALDAAAAAVKPDLEFQKTKTSAAAKVTELESLVNSALKAELQRQVNELTKEQADQATTILANLTSLKDSLTSLQDLVSKGLAMQVDYPQKYYDADNKADFDAALLKASSVFPAFQWTDDSIVVPAPDGDALPNPRAWTKAREKSEFVLQNFLIAPAQAAPTTAPTESGSGDGSGGGTSAAASATVRAATGTEEAVEDSESSEVQTAPTADLTSTVSYLKSLNDSLKAETDKLNGDTTENKTAYYKADAGRTLYWDGFMPRIVIERFDTTWTENTRNRNDLVAWFQNTSNWSQVSEQLTKKLGVEKLRNVNLVYKNITWVNSPAGAQHKIPTVTFTVEARDGYTLADDSTRELSLVVRNLYNSSAVDATTLFPYQGASSSAAPAGSTPSNNAAVIRDVNVYMNYTGPSIVLDQAVPAVGTAANTSLNGTSNVTGAFNNAFRGLLFTKRLVNPLMQSVINYVNKFDPKFPAAFVTNATNGVVLTKVQKDRQKKIENLDQEI
nr:hypothetical protein [Mycoplasmopsis synoviae]